MGLTVSRRRLVVIALMLPVFTVVGRFNGNGGFWANYHILLRNRNQSCEIIGRTLLATVTADATKPKSVVIVRECIVITPPLPPLPPIRGVDVCFFRILMADRNSVAESKRRHDKEELAR